MASSGTTRRTKRRLRLGPYVIPAGTLLLVPFDAVHHFRGNWEQPDDFIPVRMCPALHIVFARAWPCSQQLGFRIWSGGMNVLTVHRVSGLAPLAKPMPALIAATGHCGREL